MHLKNVWNMKMIASGWGKTILMNFLDVGTDDLLCGINTITI